MFAEVIDGTANSNLWLIVALILAVVLCVYRIIRDARRYDAALVAAIIVFVLAAAIDAF